MHPVSLNSICDSHLCQRVCAAARGMREIFFTEPMESREPSAWLYACCAGDTVLRQASTGDIRTRGAAVVALKDRHWDASRIWRPDSSYFSISRANPGR